MKKSTAYIYIHQRKNFIFSVLLVALLFISCSAFAQYQAKASLDSTTVLIGRQSTLTIELTKPNTAPVYWPSFADTLGGVDVVSASAIDTVAGQGGSVTLRQYLKVTAFDSGFFVIPPVNFYASSNDTSVLASTNPLLFTVQTIPIDTTKEFIDIKGVREVPFSWRDYIYYIIGAIVLIHLILLGVYLYYRFKKKKSLPSLFKKAPEVPPHVIALNALKELDAGKHWQNGQYKFYHASISDIIRTYIEKRWNVPAMEQTTDEILSSQLITFIDDDVKQKLSSLLRIADLAKFAKLQPLANENEQSMRDATDFINLTTPQEVPTEKEVKA